MGQLFIVGLLIVIIFLWLKNKELSNSSHTPQNSKSHKGNTPQSFPSKVSTSQPSSDEPAAPIEQQASQSSRRGGTHRTQEPSLNTGISELDGPGMFHRLNGCGPQGHVCYLLHSSSHSAYKVGICRPERLGIRIRDIRRTVSDARLAGTAVFTTYQNAFDAEQEVIGNNRNYRYRGITGDHAGGTEWLCRRPTQRRPAFTSPMFVEDRYKRQSNEPLPTLNIPDVYTIYLTYSKIKNAYKAKWCKTENLTDKLRTLREEAPDVKVLSRIKIERHEKAREITKKLNEENGSYTQSGGTDLINWSTNPSYLSSFKRWDENGNRISE